MPAASLAGASPSDKAGPGVSSAWRAKPKALWNSRESLRLPACGLQDSLSSEYERLAANQKL
jgi:hypothetical protein